MARSEGEALAEELEAMGDQERNLHLLQVLALNMRSTADAILLVLDAMGGLPAVDPDALESAQQKVHTFGGNLNQEEETDGG